MLGSDHARLIVVAELYFAEILHPLISPATTAQAALENEHR